MSSIVVPAPERPPGSPLASIKHIIAVGSGKGGVGKSTTAANLALALKSLGARVGILDADIYGPSQPKLLGMTQAPTENERGKITAPEAYGMKVISMGLLGDVPAVWRGPMASKAIGQFLGEVEWGELDYLIIDLPPGTGDVQITLSQSARLAGAVVVMTPQVLAKDIAKKGLRMFHQVRVPILGLVENMSEHVCSQCGHIDRVFRSGGADELSKEMSVPVLGRIPLDSKLVEDSDNGVPVVVSRPDSAVAIRYFDIARSLVAELSAVLSGARAVKAQVVSMEPNSQTRAFKIVWNDGKQSLMSFRDLRFLCPCANCVDEHSGVRKIRKEQVAEDIQPLKVQTIGNYALSIHWSDGHSTGIYSYDMLRAHLVKSPS